MGSTLLVFTILQVAPDGPFERAVKQLKAAKKDFKNEETILNTAKDIWKSDRYWEVMNYIASPKFN